MENVKGFNPLPPNCSLKKSNLHGYGVFAEADISKDFDFGVTHVSDNRFPDGYIRTALGSYVNHSNEPNIIGVQHADSYKMIAKRAIKRGEELTVDYADFNYDQSVISTFK